MEMERQNNRLDQLARSLCGELLEKVFGEMAPFMPIDLKSNTLTERDIRTLTLANKIVDAAKEKINALSQAAEEWDANLSGESLSVFEREIIRDIEELCLGKIRGNFEGFMEIVDHLVTLQDPGSSNIQKIKAAGILGIENEWLNAPIISHFIGESLLKTADQGNIELSKAARIALSGMNEPDRLIDPNLPAKVANFLSERDV